MTVPPTTCRGCRCVVDPDDSVRVDWQFFTSNGSEYFCGACAARVNRRILHDAEAQP